MKEDTRRKIDHNISLQSYNSHPLFSKGIEASVLCQTDERRETKTDCHIVQELLLSLTITCCVIFKTPLNTFSASRWVGILNWKRLLAATTDEALSVTASLVWLSTSLTPTDLILTQGYAYIIS